MGWAPPIMGRDTPRPGLPRDELRALADLRRYGELVHLDPDCGGWWRVPDRGYKVQHTEHAPDVIRRLTKRGCVVIVRETRAVLAPTGPVHISEALRSAGLLQARRQLERGDGE